MPTNLKMLREADLCGENGLTGLRKTAWQSQVAAGLAPPPVKIGQRAKAWPAHEVEAVLAARVAGVNEEQLREIVRDLVAARAQFAVRLGVTPA